MASSGYHRTQLLLDPDQHHDLAEIARRERRSVSDIVRKMIDVQLAEHKRRELALAAQALLADYSSDKELTAFTSLDAEEVR
jgi:hypothetical protein